jgi:predicted NUDIX family NTP pyrophosphohydrolase
MRVHSGGILLFRRRGGRLQVLLVHPGGPYWENRDEGAWSIPKGLFEENEVPHEAARREFAEETGFVVEGEFIELGEQLQPSKKTVHAWALEGDLDATRIASNTFSLQWPPGSGRFEDYPEIDRGQWFDIDKAGKKITKGQAVFLERLIEILKADSGT